MKKITKFKPQVPSEHYFNGYNTKERWMSYWYQINEVIKTKPKKVLEIGVGNRTVANYLKTYGIEVITADIDKNLEPDYVCSVTELSKYFVESSFDTVLCAEVLEHIPFIYFENALYEIQKVTKQYAIISLPHFGIKFQFSFKIPLVKGQNILIKFPLPRKHRFNGEHYWEIGKKNFPLNRILLCFSKFFSIERYFFVPENPYHMFFILRCRK